MIVIELSNRRYDPQQRQIVIEPAARIEVDGAQLTVVEGDPGWGLLTETVLNHPHRPDEDLTFEDDAELWALTLPDAFRTGDTVIAVRREPEREEIRSQPQPVAAERAAAAGWR
jgi:hypothetical protein